MSLPNSIQDYSVLIIDDEPHIGTVLVQLFELEGIKAFATTDPKGIAKLLDRDWTGVVISDVNMPQLDGISLMQQIRQQDPDLPVVLLTGFGDIAMAVNALKQGAYDFLEKAKAGLPEMLRNVADDQRVTQIRLVAAVFQHCLAVRDARIVTRRDELFARKLAEHARED